MGRADAAAQGDKGLMSTYRPDDVTPSALLVDLFERIEQQRYAPGLQWDGG